MPPFKQQQGFTLVELLVAVALVAILFAGLSGVIGQAININDSVRDSNDLTRQARFAMQRMVQAVSNSRLILLPLNDKPLTNWPENIRDQSVPPQPPIGSSTLATAVLAVTVPAYQDLDGDGFPDADDDRDGRVDEDLANDAQNDFGAGIYLIDDDGDGSVDAGANNSDDESITVDDDPINGVDDDNDNNIDEDPSADMNGDGLPGIGGVDDDGDGLIDEGGNNDDDEDGATDEDWYNPLVFYLANGTLMERTPVPWDESDIGGITGRDFIVELIAENVTRFRVERVPQNEDRSIIVDLTLELTSPVNGETVSLNTRVRVGGAL